MPTTHLVPRSPTLPSRLRRGVPAAAVALVTLAAAGPAAASGPASSVRSVSPFERAIAPIAGPALPATNEGIVAWTIDRVDDANKRLLIDVWVLRSGTPTKVATLPDTAKYGGPDYVPTGTQELEVGTDRSRRPVAIVRTVGGGNVGIDHTRIVSLLTGKARELPRTRGGLVVESTAVDRGVLYWTIDRRKPTDRSTSSLWRASLDGTTVGRPAKIRTSQRGHNWYTVIADRGRVGINATHDPRKPDGSEFSDDFSFGTPRGRWSVADNLPQYAGPSNSSHAMTGFTKGGALVTVQSRPDEDAPDFATLNPGGRGTKRYVLLGTGPDDVVGALRLQASTGRFLTVGPATGGPPSIGYSGVAFVPGD